MTKRVLLVIAQEEFSDDEYRKLKVFFENRGHEVTTAASTRNAAVSTLQQIVRPDRAVAEINANDFELIILIGGPGATEYLEDDALLQLLRDYMKRRDTVVAAIGHGAAVLAEAGLLLGKDATGKPAHEEYLKNRGATYTGMPIVTDGRIVTAKEKSDIYAFARTIVGLLE